jgi:hypothetical protein
MKTEIDEFDELVITFDSYDLCYKCTNRKKCPLVQALYQEIVILHYSDIQIKECGLFKKG